MSNIDNIKNLTILIVDDNSQNIQIVHAVLQKAGYEKIAFATSGKKALELTDTLNPDLILLDIMMPQMDGYEVLKELKSNESTSEIPIIFLTAKANYENVIKGFDLGVVDYITKPFDNEILLARVKTHLTLRYQALLLQEEKLLLEERVEEELEKRLQSSIKLNALYEQTNLAISFIDKNGKFLDVNKRLLDILGYSKEEILDLDVDALTHEDDIGITTQAFKNICENNLKYLELEKRCLKKDGSSIWFSVILAKINNTYNDGSFYIASICKDITQEILLREKLKEKEEILVTQSRQASMGNMIGMIAHQWKQPLGIIGMIASNIELDIILETPIDNETLKTNIYEVNGQVKYLSETIEDFKNYFKPNKEKVHILASDVMEQTLNLVGHNLTSHNITIDKKYNVQTKVDIFPNELMQVFMNIINNAKDAIISNNIKNSIIIINIMEDNENIIITIADNAGGIPAKVLDKIGELYFSTKGDEGTGLGMYMSKVIIEQHLNGTFKWESKNDGALFYILIPKQN